VSCVGRRASAAIALALASASAGGSTAAGAVPAEPACRAVASLDPPRAVVGQQVLYRVRITSREDVARVQWSQTPAFPRLRTEMLPGDPQPVIEEPRPGTRVRDERRALFAEAPGRYLLEAPELRCLLRGGAVETAAIPVVALEVGSAPSSGRPADWSGVVGPLGLHVSVSPRELALGGSVRVAVMVRGEGNLWVLPAPYDADAFPGSELFERRPKLVLDRGRRLSVRRHFAWDVVPRAPGTLLVPALALPYFDPTNGRYAVARSEAVRVEVRPRAAPRSAAPPDARPAPRGEGARAPGVSRSPWLALALLALIAGFGVRGWRRRQRGRAPARRAGANADDAGAEDEATRLERALRAALARHIDDAASVTPQELIARDPQDAAVASAAHLLAALERARFDPQAPPPDAAAVRRAIAAL
jgi:hypothetical protein